MPKIKELEINLNTTKVWDAFGITKERTEEILEQMNKCTKEILHATVHKAKETRDFMPLAKIYGSAEAILMIVFGEIEFNTLGELMMIIHKCQLVYENRDKLPQEFKDELNKCFKQLEKEVEQQS